MSDELEALKWVMDLSDLSGVPVGLPSALEGLAKAIATKDLHEVELHLRPFRIALSDLPTCHQGLGARKKFHAMKRALADGRWYDVADLLLECKDCAIRAVHVPLVSPEGVQDPRRGEFLYKMELDDALAYQAVLTPVEAQYREAMQRLNQRQLHAKAAFETSKKTHSYYADRLTQVSRRVEHITRDPSLDYQGTWAIRQEGSTDLWKYAEGVTAKEAALFYLGEQGILDCSYELEDYTFGVTFVLRPMTRNITDAEDLVYDKIGPPEDALGPVETYFFQSHEQGSTYSYD